MLWREKAFDYSFLVPPLKKPINTFTAAEAESFYVWFRKQIPGRINYLSTRCAEYLGLSQEKIDLSPNSLMLVWKWFLKIAEVERTPQQKLDHLMASYREYPYAFQEYLLNQQKEQFSLQTEYILRDIGMYIGEVFTKENPAIRWGYYTRPKTDFFVNKPLLLGFVDSRSTPPFQTEFEPIHMVGVQASNIWDKTHTDYDLLNLYQKWLMFIPPQRG